MVIYQTLDELNYPVDNYLDMIVAVQTEEDLKNWQLEEDFQDLDFDFSEDLSWIGVA